jgi:hypothetical protein
MELLDFDDELTELATDDLLELATVELTVEDLLELDAVASQAPKLVHAFVHAQPTPGS